MNESVLYNLARLVLPSEVLDYFDVIGVDSSETEMHIHLDEKMNEELRDDINFESEVSIFLYHIDYQYYKFYKIVCATNVQQKSEKLFPPYLTLL